MSIGSPEPSQFCIVGTKWRYLNAGSLKPRKPFTLMALNQALYFLGYASPRLRFDMIIALVLTRYHGDKETPKLRNFANVGTKLAILECG